MRSEDNVGDITHLDDEGRARMVDVGAKAESLRIARASGKISMNLSTLEAITAGKITKGDVLAVAQVAAVTAVKQTAVLIPMCHPLRISGVSVKFTQDIDLPGIRVEVEVKAIDRTGVEMEAMTGTAVALLTIYDMCKALQRDMIVGDILLEYKAGGKSGEWLKTS